MKRHQVVVGKSRNNAVVWYDPISSHTATHFSDSPSLKELSAEALANSDVSGDFMLFHVDMKRTVGTSDLVKNQPGDEIVYAKRLNRKEYTVFNKSRKPEPSRLVSIAVEKREDGTYELVSAWIGPSNSPSFPGTPRETPDSKPYWAQHSLAWGKQAVQPGTETKESPW